MTSQLTVGDIFRTGRGGFLSQYGSVTPAYQKRALSSIALCQTAALGGNVVECPHCGHREIHYRSCYQRGCPTCEGLKDATWMKERVKDLLPVQYFHVVFTIPHILNELFLHNQRLCFSLFFDAVKETLMTVGRNRFHGEIGFFAIMHTWGQQLSFHPHIHCVVPGGALTKENQWIPSSKKQPYFASHKVLSLVFRGILIKKLKRVHLKFTGDLEQLCTESVKKKWVVHCKPPFSGPIRVIQYLARYTRKVAISNSRLIELNNGQVSFTWKDYANGSESKVMQLKTTEFIRRFLSHIPLPRFVRIRHFGFLSNKKRNVSIPLIRELIGEVLPDGATAINTVSFGKCPLCRVGFFVVVSEVLKQAIQWNSS